MASPQEVIEAAMVHPADSTPESRRAASSLVLRALAANEYGFMRRPLPVSDLEDGQCQTCKTEIVHVDHGEPYIDALHRNHALTQRIVRLETALRMIAENAAPASDVAMRALTGQ